MTATTAWSIALRDIPHPDYAEATIVTIGPHGSVDPAAWARRIFDIDTVPGWVATALRLRQIAVRLVGIPPATHDVFRIREHGDDEVLIAADDTHLDFRCAVAIDEGMRLLRVTTTVKLHGWRGRAYFVPVRLLHPLVMRAMIRSAHRWFERADR
jgi:hypothetical protein